MADAKKPPLTAPDILAKCKENPLGPEGTRLQGALDLHGADLTGIAFEDGAVDLSDADLSGASLGNTFFKRINFSGSNLTGASVEGARFIYCNFERAALQDLEGRAEFTNPELKGANLSGLDLWRSEVTDSVFTAKNWHLARYGAEDRERLGLPPDHNDRVGSRSFDKYPFEGRALEGFDFQRASLVGAKFQAAALDGADFTGADLLGADLYGSEIGGAKLTPAQVRSATNWLWARFGPDKSEKGSELRAELKLPPDHDARARAKDFRDCDFSGFDLRDNLLAGVNLVRARLTDADLSGQKDLTETLLHDADFTGSSLRGSNLEKAEGLEAWQFRGTDLTGAALPTAIGEFKGVESVSKIAPSVAKQFLGLLAACLYCWLTIAATTDVALILGSATLALPVVQTPIRIAGFYWFAPAVLLIVFLYFQLNLQRMWEALAKLPAIFPDGRRLDERVYPWMLIQKVRAYYGRLQGEYTFVPQLENFLGSALAYAATPITLLAFGYRALVKHDVRLTGWHVALFTVSLLIAMQFQRYARDTLRGVPPKLGWRLALRSSWRLAACLAIGAMLWVVASRQLTTMTADLEDAELSIKPDGWVDGQADISGVKGAKLSGAHLENARMSRAFLVVADLTNADLSGADLRLADLRGAILTYAEMRDSSLVAANLEGASLTGARFSTANILTARNWLLAHYDHGGESVLHLPVSHEGDLIRRDFRGYTIKQPWFGGAGLAGANFEAVHLEQADFSSADLTNAILRGCRIDSAVFTGAKLTKTDLRGAALGDAWGLTEPQLREAILDTGTKLPAAFQDLIPRAAKKKP